MRKQIRVKRTSNRNWIETLIKKVYLIKIIMRKKLNQ